MSGFRVVHRFAETKGGVMRVVESGLYDPEADDNPDWVTEALAEADAAEDTKPHTLAETGDQTDRAQPSSQIDARPLGGEPDLPVEDVVPDPEVAGAEAARAARAESEDDESEDEVPVPPKGGAGSGVQAWASYAQANDVELTEGMTRDDIIAACEAAGVPTE